MDMELPDLESLNEEERQLILSVLRRDEELRSGLQSRASQVKQEVQELRMKSVLRNGDDLSKMCARCKTPFGFLFNTGDVCPVCRFRVCKDCRQTTLNSQGWMCSLCFKENQLLWLSNENLADGSGEEEEEEEEEEGEGEVTGSDTLSLPPLSTSDHPSSLNTSPPATLYAGNSSNSHEEQDPWEEEEEGESEVKERNSRGEEDAGGGDSAYSTSGSAATSVRNDHGLSDLGAEADGSGTIMRGDHDHAQPDSPHGRPVVGAMDSLDDVESISDPDVSTDCENASGSVDTATGDGRAGREHSSDSLYDEDEDDDETATSKDSCAASFGSQIEDDHSSENGFSFESTQENDSKMSSCPVSAVEEENAPVHSPEKAVPTLEEQMAVVQKMRTPDHMSYTMQRFFQSDDTGSDTLSIISERTEPEDSENKTEKEYTMYSDVDGDGDSDSEGTVHDELDEHWSDDPDDVVEVGATTPRRLSFVEVNEAEFQRQRADSEGHSELDSDDHTPPVCDSAQDVQVDDNHSESKRESSPESVQSSSRSEDPSIQTDVVVMLQDTTPGALTDTSKESRHCVPSEDTSTQTEEVFLITKEEWELFHELMMQQERGRLNLCRTFSEAWAQTESPPMNEDPPNSDDLGSEDFSDCQENLVNVAAETDSLVFHDATEEQETAHEAERRRTASATDQSHQSDRDHVDGDEQAEEAGTMLPAQRSNSMGDLLRDDSPSVSQMPYKKRTFTGSVDQLDRDADNDVDGAVSRYRKKGKPLSRSRFSLAASRESLASVYSSAGETNFGRIPVTGEITFGLDYDQKQSALRIHLKGCQDLAPVDTKHNRSDPYVKTYLLPDMTRSGKRKSKIKKRTLNPVYNETLSYTISAGELETRTLWVTVWHSDRFGRNDFLGEVNLPMDMELFDDASPRTYSLQSRMVDDPSDTGLQYKGELILSLMYVTADKVLAAREEAPKKSKSRSKKSKMAAAAGPSLGELHVMVKAAKHLMAVRSSGASDPFVKGYLLPERKRAGKQKTPVVKNSLNPMWNHILVFEGIDAAELEDRSLELTVWDHETLGTNEFLGGTRLNLGTGATKDGHQVEWMDGRGEESTAWKNMMAQPDTWVDAVLPSVPL